MNEDTQDIELEVEEGYQTCNITKVENAFIVSLGAGPERILSFEIDYDLDDKEGFQAALVQMMYNIAEYFGVGNDIVKKKGEKTLIIDLVEKE